METVGLAVVDLVELVWTRTRTVAVVAVIVVVVV